MTDESIHMIQNMSQDKYYLLIHVQVIHVQLEVVFLCKILVAMQLHFNLS